MRWPPVILVYSRYLWAICPIVMSCWGVISPAATRGTTEYVPSFWILARKRSFVSCRGALSRASTKSFQHEARIDATAGLHTSQPRPFPCLVSISSNVCSPPTRAKSNSSLRENAKCSQIWLLTATPRRLSSVFKTCVTSGAHPPQELAALVHCLSAPIVLAPPAMAAHRSPLLTLLQEQICAVSGSATNLSGWRPLSSPTG